MGTDIPRIQEALRDQGIDGWLLYDFHGINPVAGNIIGLPPGKFLTRRWYYFIPVSGEPRGLFHAIEASHFENVPGRRSAYRSWQEIEQGLEEMLHDARRVAMEYSPECAIPYISRVDAGTVELVRRVGPEVIVSAHCHNDMGLATANTIAAVQHGARQVEVTVNGIGERAGNTSLEEVAVALAMKGIASTGIDLTQIAAVSAKVEEATGVARQANRAIVGANAFAHSSGIHQDGIIKNPKNYEFVPPAMVGAKGHKFVFTSKSGRSAIAHHARTMGYDLAPGEVDAVYRRFIQTADEAEAAVPEQVIDAIIEEVASEAPAAC